MGEGRPHASSDASVAMTKSGFGGVRGRLIDKCPVTVHQWKIPNVRCKMDWEVYQVILGISGKEMQERWGQAVQGRKQGEEEVQPEHLS